MPRRGLPALILGDRAMGVLMLIARALTSQGMCMGVFCRIAQAEQLEVHASTFASILAGKC